MRATYFNSGDERLIFIIKFQIRESWRMYLACIRKRFPFPLYIFKKFYSRRIKTFPNIKNTRNLFSFYLPLYLPRLWEFSFNGALSVDRNGKRLDITGGLSIFSKKEEFQGAQCFLWEKRNNIVSRSGGSRAITRSKSYCAPLEPVWIFLATFDQIKLGWNLI